ncbi:hypothetical protein P9314_03045 [Paenibacillus validus]|uniref:hypothetical protein n=1 Tax=Paenibacillus TaxID=44249 RepID=UPI000FD75A52|nr:MULTISPECIES: hypothetical protein [Paenibacillus]MED4599681.1 hypothetical protein [Paenibacillus validus]MED4604886.1 hypothetical protein [Paenibacillus validus]
MLEKNFLIADEILFDAKPDAVPYNYRISYKLAQLCLILEMCCGRGGCSLLKLHMISIGLSTNNDMEKLSDFANDRLTNYTIVRFDPAVNHAVKYALAEELFFQQQNGLFRLTKKGKAYVKKIIRNTDLLSNEKRYLFTLSNKLTEEKINNLTSLWRYSNVEN